MKKILCVDDDRLILKLLESVLSRDGFNINCELSGREALKNLELNLDYSLIITDYMMPGMNGLQLIKKAYENYQKKEISLPPIIIHSGTVVFKNLNDFLESGATGYLQKPVQPQTLKTICHELTEKGESATLTNYMIEQFR